MRPFARILDGAAACGRALDAMIVKPIEVELEAIAPAWSELLVSFDPYRALARLLGNVGKKTIAADDPPRALEPTPHPPTSREPRSLRSPQRIVDRARARGRVADLLATMKDLESSVSAPPAKRSLPRPPPDDRRPRRTLRQFASQLAPRSIEAEVGANRVQIRLSEERRIERDRWLLRAIETEVIERQVVSPPVLETALRQIEEKTIEQIERAKPAYGDARTIERRDPVEIVRESEERPQRGLRGMAAAAARGLLELPEHERVPRELVRAKSTSHGEPEAKPIVSPHADGDDELEQRLADLLRREALRQGIDL